MATDLFGGSETVGALTSQMTRLDSVTNQFGRSLSRALSAGIIQGKSFDDILRSLGQKLIEISLRAAFKPLETGITSLLGGLTSSLTGALSGGASGGSLVSGLFGGSPASALSGLGGGLAAAAAPKAGVTVNMAVSTPDAASFARSEAQISAALARAVSRGQRSL
jgi:phage-related minor tail protein